MCWRRKDLFIEIPSDTTFFLLKDKNWNRSKLKNYVNRNTKKIAHFNTLTEIEVDEVLCIIKN